MKKLDDKRLLAIPKMLTEIAQGNFAYRMERSEKNDMVEALVMLLNMTAEELADSVTHMGSQNPDISYYNTVALLCLIDVRGTILAIDPGAHQLLGRTRSEFATTPFIKLLRPESQMIWEDLILGNGNEEDADTYLDLVFDTKENIPLKLGCNIIPLLSNEGLPKMTIVVAAHIAKKELEKENRSYRMSLIKDRSSTLGKLPNGRPISEIGVQLSMEDIQKIKEVRNHLLNNLEKPMDSLVHLARAFGTNEFKLKKGFKQLNGETVSGFLQKERLRKAALLIEHSDRLVKEVAKMTGFKNTTHFSRVFKEHFGESPRKYRQKLMDPGDQNQ